MRAPKWTQQRAGSFGLSPEMGAQGAPLNKKKTAKHKNKTRCHVWEAATRGKLWPRPPRRGGRGRVENKS